MLDEGGEAPLLLAAQCQQMETILAARSLNLH
jgi:hypothetical protein